MSSQTSFFLFFLITIGGVLEVKSDLSQTPIDHEPVQNFLREYNLQQRLLNPIVIQEPSQQQRINEMDRLLRIVRVRLQRIQNIPARPIEERKTHQQLLSEVSRLLRPLSERRARGQIIDETLQTNVNQLIRILMRLNDLLQLSINRYAQEQQQDLQRQQPRGLQQMSVVEQAVARYEGILPRPQDRRQGRQGGRRSR